MGIDECCGQRVFIPRDLGLGAKPLLSTVITADSVSAENGLGESAPI